MTSDNETRTLNWTVGPQDILQEAEGRGNVFWINVYQSGPPWTNLNSRAFNVTNSSISSSATSPATTISTASQTKVFTTTAFVTETISGSPTSSPAVVYKGNALRTGLGVGLGLGIPLAIIVSIIVFRYCLASPQRNLDLGSASAVTGPPPYELHPPQESVTHEVQGGEQDQGADKTSKYSMGKV